MPIFDVGSLNISALDIPDVYVGIVPPNSLIPGSNSAILGLVGTASSGPVNKAVIISDPAAYRAIFGNTVNRKFDIGTGLEVASLQGAADFRIVRVTDGTDVKASIAMASGEPAAAIAFYTAVANAVNSGIGVLRNGSALVNFNTSTGTFTAIYSGSHNNATIVSVGVGSRTGTFAVSIQNGVASEIFDNLPADAGHPPTVASYNLVGGTDGAGAVTAATLVGDATAFTGMYALHNQKMSAFVLCDCDDATQWSVQIAFAKQETSLAIVAGPAGDVVSTAITRKRAAGLDDWRMWILHGDEISWSDQTNAVIRKVSPAFAAAGEVMSLSPEQSPLNKPLTGILGSERCGVVGSGYTATYGRAELSALFDAGIDVITNPAPGGAYWAVRAGHNCSSEATQQSIAYTTMTNFIARSINDTMGKYIGKVISTTQVKKANAELNAFFAGLASAEMIGSLDGKQSWLVVCDATNNPTARTGIGYLQASIQCKYLGIIEKFIIDLQGGANVIIGG